MQNYAAIIAEIESRGVFPNAKPSVKNIAAALDKSGLKDKIDPSRVIVVAGTNGKGSTCATLEALLLSAGQKTGFYSSPHLINTTERIRMDGIDISQSDFCRIYTQYRLLFEEHHLSHFEILTFMAAAAFIERQVDWMIFEVGLGGLWDATNAVPHHWCVITPMDFDHTHLLGNTIIDIALNKFGIISEGNTVIYAPLAPEVDPMRANVDATWIPRNPYDYSVENDRSSAPQFFIHYKGYKAALHLPGGRGAQNAALALTVFETLGFDAVEHLPALARVNWPGRMERVDHPDFSCPVYLSGDHNPHGIASLLEVMDHYTWNTLHVVVGIGQNKDIGPMLEELSQLRNMKLYLTQTTFKPVPLDTYGAWRQKAVLAKDDWRDILSYLQAHAQKGDMILVTGSLYLVGDVRGELITKEYMRDIA